MITIKNIPQLKESLPLSNFEKTGSSTEKRSKIGSIRIIKMRLT